MANSVDPDPLPFLYGIRYMGLHCLLRPACLMMIISCLISISALSISYGDDGILIKKGAKQSAIQSVS